MTVQRALPDTHMVMQIGSSHTDDSTHQLINNQDDTWTKKNPSSGCRVDVETAFLGE